MKSNRLFPTFNFLPKHIQILFFFPSWCDFISDIKAFRLRGAKSSVANPRKATNACLTFSKGR